MKKEIEIGDALIVEFLRNEKGGKPICRINGKIGFIIDKFPQFVAPRSVWLVEVVTINRKSIEVLPIQREKTAWRNLKDIDAGICDAFGKTIINRKKKTKRHFPYLSKQQREKLN